MQRWILRLGHMEWLLRFSSPLNYFNWSYLKSDVRTTNPKNIEESKYNIRVIATKGQPATYVFRFFVCLFSSCYHGGSNILTAMYPLIGKKTVQSHDGRKNLY